MNPEDVRVLIACECSQTECAAFRALGFSAFSCDLQPSYGSLPQYHIQGDALDVMNSFTWHLIIAHPPCTYLSAAGASLMHNSRSLRPGNIDPQRYALMLAARAFFFAFWQWEGCPIAIENPRPLRLACLPPRSQVICPSDFGHPYTKRTYLWLKGLPPLLPTHYHDGHIGSWLDHCSRSNNRRSKSFEGVAAAMAAQWGGLFL